MAKDMFELNENATDNDILNSPINEESEFEEPESRPDHHFDPKNSVAGMKSDNILVSEDEYNDGMKAAKKAIKTAKTLMEQAEAIVNDLSNARVDSSVTSPQMNFVEEAMLVAYEDGPYFEASDDKDKGDCKAAARKLRNSVMKAGKKEKLDMVKVSVLASKGDVDKDDDLWKVVGVACGTKEAVEAFVKSFSETNKGNLDGCKLSVSEVTKSQLEAINAKRKTPTDTAFVIKVSKK